MRRHPFRNLLSLLVLVTALQMVGCSDGETLTPDASLAQLVGDWVADHFVVRSKANPSLAPDLITDLRAQFSVNVQPSGQYTAILVYQGTPFTEIGIIEVEGSDVIFRVSFPSARTNRSRFSLTAGRLVLDGDTEFDFNLDGTAEPAVAHIDLRKK